MWSNVQHVCALCCALGLGLFSLFWVRPFVPIKGKLNSTVYTHILDNSVLQLCGNSLGTVLSCFNKTITLYTKSIKKYFFEFGVYPSNHLLA